MRRSSPDWCWTYCFEDKSNDSMLNYAAFLEFYPSSRDWMERYDQPLRELVCLGEQVGN